MGILTSTKRTQPTGGPRSAYDDDFALKTELRELKAAMQEQGERFDELIEHLRGSNNL